MKKIARYQQFRASEKIARRVVETAVAAQADPTNKKLRRGVIWHTQGSGKTLTMVFTSYELRLQPELNDPTIYIVVDRKDLRTQLGDTFDMVEFPNTKRPPTVGALKAKIRERPSEVIITTIQKFRDLQRDPDFRPDDRSNVIVLVDEAHRTQYGHFHSELQAAFPNACFFAFTGTPIPKTHKTFGAVQSGVLEAYLDRYSIEDAILDGATVEVRYTYGPQDLWLDREQLNKGWAEITKELDEDEKQEVQKRVQPWKEFLKGEQRVARLARDIAEDFRKVVEPNGFKAQVVAVDKAACKLYYDELLKYFRPEELQIVISETTKAAGDETYNLLKDFNLGDAEVKSVIKRFKRRITDAEKKSGNELKILIVCNMLLTGFDAPIEQTMYLDSPLRDHNLLQAIARTNRTYEDPDTGLEKKFGRVVDYVGVFKNYREALAYEPEDVPGFKTVDELAEKFPEVVEKALKHFDGITLEDSYDCATAIYRRIAEIDQTQFRKDVREAVQAYEALSPHPILAKPEVSDRYDWLLTIYRMFLREMRMEFDAEAYAAKTRELIRQSSRMKSFGGHLPEIAIDARYLENLRLSKLSADDKAEKILRDIETIIREHEAENPAYIDLDERLQELLRKKREASQSIEQLLIEIEELYKTVDEVGEQPKREGFKDRGRYDLFLDLKHALGNKFDDAKVRAFVELLIAGLEKSLFQTGWHEFDPMKKRVADTIRVVGDGPDFEGMRIGDNHDLVEQLLKRLIQHYGR